MCVCVCVCVCVRACVCVYIPFGQMHQGRIIQEFVFLRPITELNILNGNFVLVTFPG